MNEKEIEVAASDGGAAENQEIEVREFSLTDFKLNLVSSAERLHEGETHLLPENELKFAAGDGEEAEIEIEDEEPSEIFKELSEPKLPALPRENRARLQMQSPNRIFFYWSLKNDPFQTLQRMFGSRAAAEFTFVARLINKTSGAENLYRVPAAGSWWFDVESDAAYQVEVGFAAPNRPFIRLLFSNTIETPRSAPSPYFDLSPRFAVSAQEFAEVLDVSGYKQDAFEMALAGDEAAAAADAATEQALSQLFGRHNFAARTNELRYVLFALAAGATLADLRGQISPTLFAELERLMTENAARLSAERIFNALQENFDLEGFEETTEEDAEEISERTFGASLVNFRRSPRRLAKKFPKYARPRPEAPGSLQKVSR
jgi:hypothetical protein